MALPTGLQYNNQLQFNLNVASDPQNVMTRFMKPGPIILEKVGPTPREPPTSRLQKVSPVKLSDASEEKLAWALQLARRDLKNMIHQQRASEENAQKQNVGGRKKKGKTTKKSSAFSRAPKPAQKQPPRNVFKKSVKTQTPPTKETYYSRRGLLDNLPPGSAQKLQTERWRSPAQPKESGIRETSAKGKSFPTKEKLSPSSRQAEEIKKLRNELKFYVQRIEKLTREAHGAPSPSRDDEDEKHLLRREVKRAEQTSRSSRLLYSLQQQVRELQEDLGRTGPEKMKHTKRTQILSRLAAAHRGAVRILQAFLHQLPDHVTDEGTLPPIYQELGRLINKLSLCTSHLEVDHNGFPEEVLQIFEKFQTPEMRETPSARRRQIPIGPGSRSSRRKLAFGKNLFTGRDEWREKPTVSPLFKEFLPSQPISAVEGYDPGKGTAQRLRTDATNQIATPGSPERDAAIKAGLEALMRIEGPGANSGQSRPRNRPLKPQGRAPPSKGRKGVLLPSKPRLFPNTKQLGPRTAGYLQKTKASQLKEQAAQRAIAEKSKQDGKPPWAPPGSPRSFHQSPKSQRERTEVQLDDGEPGVEGREPGPPRIRRVLFEGGLVPGQDGDVVQRDGTGWPDRGAGSGRRWEQEEDVEYASHHVDSRSLPKDAEAMVDQAERAILERLQPLLDRADEIARQQEMSQEPTQHSVQDKLSRKMTETVSDHADLILEDVIGDTAHELQDIEGVRDVERIAGGMENASDYETLLQELERMEAEEENIRRRWRKVSYYDPQSRSGPDGVAKVPDKRRGMVMGRPLEGELLEWIDEVPVDHTGIQFTTDLPASGRTITIIQPDLPQRPISDTDDESTGDPSQPTRGEAPSNLEHRPDWREPTGGTIKLRVPPDMERNVVGNRQSFEDHLKRRSHLVYGGFDPWKLVMDVSDDMVDGILRDIAGELAECSGGFMDALYKAEFEDGTVVNDS